MEKPSQEIISNIQAAAAGALYATNKRDRLRFGDDLYSLVGRLPPLFLLRMVDKALENDPPEAWVPMSNAKRIRLALARRAWSVRHASKVMGIPYCVLSNIVNDRRPGQRYMARISHALSIPLDWLMVRFEPPF
jgi:hypothetical protein